MGIFSSLFGGPTVLTKPGDSTLEGMQNSLFNYNPGLGQAGKIARKGLMGFAAGNYDSGVFGSMLNPIRDQFATSQREMDRNAAMGGNAFMVGSQPGLMAGLQNDARLANTQNMGLALGQAVPGLYSALSNQYQSAKNAADQGAIGSMSAAMNNRLGYYGDRYQVDQ